MAISRSDPANMHGVNNRTCQFFLSACATTIVVANLSSQTLLGPKPSAIQHVTAETSTISESTAGAAPVKRAGVAAQPAAVRKIALRVDVTPNASIHVYAPGAKEFSPVSLVVIPPAGVAAGKPVYPLPDPAPAGEDKTPAYRKTFRIVQSIALPPATKDTVIVGVLNYQACDDRLCYPVASLPVSWTIPAR
jgi:DsbC/DsbD-like thiol-disulfide interchange protein